MSSELFDAIDRHDLERLAALLEQGANANAREPQPPHRTALVVAVHECGCCGPVAALRLPLAHGARVDGDAGESEPTPLYCAVAAGDRPAVVLLLAAGADPNRRSDEGDLPFWVCIERGDREMAAALLRAGGGRTINDWGGFAGYTALGRAARKLDIAMIELLLAAGADPEARDEDGKPARERLPLAELSAAQRLLGERR